MKTTTKTMLTLASTALVCSTSLQAAALVHESFEGANGAISELNTITPGTGIDGSWRNSWSGTGFEWVQDATMASGDLGSTGRELAIKSHSVGFEASATTSALAPNLANGTTLWFSYLIERDQAGWGGGGSWEGFALGTSDFDSSANGAFLTDGGEALGILTRNNNPYTPAGWVGGGQGPTTQAASGISNLGNGVTQLLVGKIEWGAEFASETITLYSPALNDLGNLGTGVSHSVADMNQAAFDTITISARESGGNVYFDEIRFGATSDDVLGVPEPSSAALLGLGGLALIFRRRK